MGLMDDLPLERIWRDARVERIWEGTSEIQRTSSRVRCCARSGGDGHRRCKAAWREPPMSARLSRLLWPKSIAFIGGGEAEVALRKTKDLGFPGAIYAVNPKREQLAGCALPRHRRRPAGDARLRLHLDQARTDRRGGARACAARLRRRGRLRVRVRRVGAEGRRLQDDLLIAAGDMPVMGRTATAT